MIFITATRPFIRANARSLRRAYARMEGMAAVIKDIHLFIRNIPYGAAERTLYSRGAPFSLLLRRWLHRRWAFQAGARVPAVKGAEVHKA